MRRYVADVKRSSSAASSSGTLMHLHCSDQFPLLKATAVCLIPVGFLSVAAAFVPGPAFCAWRQPLQGEVAACT